MRRIWLEFTGVCAILLTLPIALLVLLVFFALITPLVFLIEVLNVLGWVAERDWMARQLWVKPRRQPVVCLWGDNSPFATTAEDTGRQAADGTRIFVSLAFSRGPPAR